jgi:hypothetical protein
MKFVFYDKSKVEMNVITDILYAEKIPYKIRPYIVKDFFFGDDDEDDDDGFCIIEEMYNIECFTDLEHFEFVKSIAEEQIRNRLNLERCYLKKESKKRVQRVHKKNIANTNRNDRK